MRVSARPALRLAAGLGWLWALQGCNGHVDGPGPAGAGDAERILNIYTWTDYIAPDTVANFERETGIRVRYDTYDSNEVLETKLLTGRTNYDIVVPTGPFFERLSRAGVFRKLDQDALPNRRNLDPDVMRRLAAHDPGNAYAVPYLWSTAGIGYNVDRVRERLGSAAIDSWAILFDPRNAAKLSDCGITVIDSPFDVLAAALLYLGGEGLQVEMQLPIAVTGTVQGMLLFFLLAADVLINYRVRLRPSRAAVGVARHA